MPATPSPGKALADKLHAAIQDIGLNPALLIHSRSIITGVTSEGKFVGGMTIDQFFAEAGQILLDSHRVFRHGNSICLEIGEANERRLIDLAADHRAEPGAAPLLANLFGVEVGGGDGAASQSLMPAKLVGALLACEPLWAALPAIRYYGRRPAFDAEFTFRGPGWHPSAASSSTVPRPSPILHEPPDDANAGALHRLPPRLRGLLGEFSWRSEADLVNAVALLLTGLLINHFIDDPHPVAIVDGNQPGVGKTLLIQAIGRVLDGAEPTRIPLGGDEELEKRLCAEVRGRTKSILLLDNVRTRIESAVLEQNVLSPELSFRVLGQSTCDPLPEYVPVGDHEQRRHGHPRYGASGYADPAATRWRPEGTPVPGQSPGVCPAAPTRDPGRAGRHGGALAAAGQADRGQRHRCTRWAATIGGILDACGPGRSFLANCEEAESEMDQGLQDLAELAEHLAMAATASAGAKGGMPIGRQGRQGVDRCLLGHPGPARADARRDRQEQSHRHRQVPGGPGRPLGPHRHDRRHSRRHPALSRGRANQKRYHFEITEPSKRRRLRGSPTSMPLPLRQRPPPRGTRRPSSRRTATTGSARRRGLRG